MWSSCLQEKVRGAGGVLSTSGVARAVEKAGMWLESRAEAYPPLTTKLLCEFLASHIIRLARVVAGERTNGQLEKVGELFDLCVAEGVNTDELKEIARVIRDAITVSDHSVSTYGQGRLSRFRPILRTGKSRRG